MPHPARKSSRKIYSALALGLFLAAPLSAEAKAPAQQPATAPPAQEVAASQTASKYPAAYLNFGARFGEEDLEGYSDMILPLLNNEQNIIFFNPRVSLMDEGANEFNLGLGYRRMVTDGLVLGGNIFVDSRESAHGNRFNQWGAGVELLSNSVDFRANYYDADNGKEKIGSQTRESSETSVATTTSTHTKRSNYSDVYASGHGLWSDYTQTTTTKYRTVTTTTLTQHWFDQYEAGMDGWDTELGFKLPLPIGPEVRLFGGYYSYDNPFGDDVDGLKARLEIKTGPYLALDAEVFEDETLNGSNFFVGARLQIPLSRDLSWSKFVDGLVSMDHRSLDERMRSEMVQRDVRVQTKDSDWQEDASKRMVQKDTQVDERSSSTQRRQTIDLAKNITFVDKDNATDTSQDGTNEHPYGDERGGIQKAVDNAGENTTIFVYEAGGQVNGISRDSSDVGGVYDEQVVMKPGQTITSEITFSGHPTQTSYATVNRPLIKPSTITYDKQVDKGLAMVDYAAAVTMPENTSLRRMAVETSQNSAAAVWVQPQLGSGTVLVDNSELHTSGSGSDALISYLDQENLESLTITGSNISTAGMEASGVLLREMYNADLGSLNVAGSSINTLGKFAGGIVAHIESSHLGSLNLTNSTISTAGNFADGVLMWMYGEADYGTVIGGPAILDSLNVSDSTINTAGEFASGLRAHVQQSNLGSLNVTNTSISSTGDFANGLDINLMDYSSLGDLRVEGSTISLQGERQNGVITLLRNSTMNNLAVTNSTITIDNTGAYANGIKADLLFQSSLGSLSVIGSTISTTGSEATGLEAKLQASKLGTMTVEGSSISTTGDRADGIQAELWNSYLEDLKITGATVSTSGGYADGLSFIFNQSAVIGSQTTVLDSHIVQNNSIITQGDSAHGVNIWSYLVNPPNPPFSAASIEANNNIEVGGSSAEKVQILP
ncbi:MAG: inverse autotransporter beta domain-containing protein [bacterium]|nr:inverse autotransporter beta domain-containing protein [bacterium]